MTAETLKTVQALYKRLVTASNDILTGHAGLDASNACMEAATLIDQMQRDAVQPALTWRKFPDEPPPPGPVLVTSASRVVWMADFARSENVWRVGSGRDMVKLPPEAITHWMPTPVAAGLAPAAPHPEAQALRHATKENGDCPHWCKACKVEADARDQQQDDHAGSPAPSEPVGYLTRYGHFFKPEERARWVEVLGPNAESVKNLRPVYTHPAPSAESSKAALSDDEIDAVVEEHVYTLRGWDYGGMKVIEVNGYREYEFARAILARAGITPQAGKESGE